jgi:hypothetical protein
MCEETGSAKGDQLRTFDYVWRGCLSPAADFAAGLLSVRLLCKRELLRSQCKCKTRDCTQRILPVWLLCEWKLLRHDVVWKTCDP